MDVGILGSWEIKPNIQNEIKNTKHLHKKLKRLLQRWIMVRWLSPEQTQHKKTKTQEQKPYSKWTKLTSKILAKLNLFLDWP